jgi:antitoxin (DNA-binding transcriptional repressor) of toxin-antitoxin stability system
MASRDTTVRVGIRELRENLSAYMRQVQCGASVHITSHDKVIAELRPPSVDQLPPRRLGTLRGKIRMAPDFDETPADLIDAMEGEA